MDSIIIGHEYHVTHARWGKFRMVAEGVEDRCSPIVVGRATESSSFGPSGFVTAGEYVEVNPKFAIFQEVKRDPAS